MEGERKKREAQDNMEKAKIKKELAKKAAEVNKHGVNSLQKVLSLCLSDENGLLVSVMIQVILSCHTNESF